MSESFQHSADRYVTMQLDQEMVGDLKKLEQMQAARGNEQPFLLHFLVRELAKSGLKSALVYEQLLLDRQDGLVF